MDLSGTYTFDVEREALWKVLMDPRAIAEALPGVDELVSIEGEEYAWRADAKISVATVNGAYAGTVRLSEISPPNQYRLTVDGEGQQSIINGSALITLDYDEATKQTTLHWQAESAISGKLAGIGQRLIKAAATMLSKRFFSSLAKQIPSSETSD